jgi:D-psicose/D-tagatose/L-ribulose 3-epimerase
VLLGCVVKTPADVEHAAGLPLDYLELKGDMLCVADGPFRALSRQLRASGLPCAAMTSPLPRRFGCRIVGDDADLPRALAVFTDMCDRAAPFGVRTVVLGSGQARSTPPSFPAEATLRQFEEFVVAACAICAERGMLLTLEPLNSTETNFVNSCAQARTLIDQLLYTGLRMTVDCYHIFSEGLSIAAEMAAASGVIGHAQTSAMPRGSMEFRPAVQEEFVAALHSAGYHGGLTIEDDFQEFGRDAADAVRVFRRILTAPGD